jgi:sulfite dehydrogenase
MRETPIGMVALAICCVLVAGCGSGSSGASTTKAVSGKQLFTTVGCSNCHTLADAGAKGQVGPNLDHLKPSREKVAEQIEHGGGGMPAFGGRLSAAQVQAIARYVAGAAGG